MPRMIEDTRQPEEQPMQPSEKAFEIVRSGETHDGIDFADVVEKAKETRADEIVDILVDFTELSENPRIPFYELLEEVAVKMLEDKA